MKFSLLIRIILVFFGGILLLTMVAYPFGYDQAVYAVGGEMIVKQGAITYRDFLDTKPPVIFLIYAGASYLFGHHESSIRVFDILFQVCSLCYFYRILLRTIKDRDIAFISVFLYVLLYTTGGYWNTCEAETFAF